MAKKHNNLNIEEILDKPELTTEELESILAPFFPMTRPTNTIQPVALPNANSLIPAAFRTPTKP